MLIVENVVGRIVGVGLPGDGAGGYCRQVRSYAASCHHLAGEPDQVAKIRNHKASAATVPVLLRLPGLFVMPRVRGNDAMQMDQRFHKETLINSLVVIPAN